MKQSSNPALDFYIQLPTITASRSFLLAFLRFFPLVGRSEVGQGVTPPRGLSWDHDLHHSKFTMYETTMAARVE